MIMTTAGTPTDRHSAQALAATLRNLTCAGAQPRTGGERRALETLRRTWISPAHQAQRLEAKPPPAPTPDAGKLARDTGWRLLERLSLGDLPGAAAQLAATLAAVKADHSDAPAWVGMLQTELELAQHELRVAGERGQLQRPLVGVLATAQVQPLLQAALPVCQAATADRRRRATGGTPPPHNADPRLAVLHAGLALLHRELSLTQRRTPSHWSAPDGSLLDRPSRQDLKALAMSQLGQDLWVLERSGYKQGGFFVEFGATDGVLLSNTWLLETYFGWRGLCAEPNPSFFPQLQANRRCGLSDQYIGAKTGETVDFLLADVYGGSAAHAADDQHGNRRAGYQAAGCVQRMTAISLHDFLLQHQAPREIDYISIDTEGSEYEILSQFPFDQWQVRLFTIEHNFTKMREPIRRLMAEHGYQCREAQWDDWFELQREAR
jgi:FkbM family methyltransferase